MLSLDPRNVMLQVQADNWEEVIRIGVRRLQENGYVPESYADEVIAREREYPTGLPTEDVFTALPHAFSESVIKTGFCALRLTKPVIFRNMADSDQELPVELVFLLANASGADAHLQALSDLMGCFSRQNLLLDLKNAADAAAFVRIMENWEEYPEA